MTGYPAPRQSFQQFLRSFLHDASRFGQVLTNEQIERLHGPVGLNISAQTPEEIALAITAEIKAVCAARGGGFLRGGGDLDEVFDESLKPHVAEVDRVSSGILAYDLAHLGHTCELRDFGADFVWQPDVVTHFEAAMLEKLDATTRTQQ